MRGGYEPGQIGPVWLEPSLSRCRCRCLIEVLPQAYPRPMKGIFVAMTVRNCTLASSGRLAM